MRVSSGDSRVQGGVTKTGNGHARRLLVEAAWHHRARIGPAAICGAAGTPAPPAARARGTPPTTACTPAGPVSTAQETPVVANAAIARELAGWCWSLAVMHD